MNIPFSQINELRTICRDVSRWSNGDIELGLASLDQLPDFHTLIVGCLAVGFLLEININTEYNVLI